MSGESGPRERSPQEMVTALDWLDAELAPEAAWEFELRLASDPELAREVEDLARMDQALRRDARARASIERTRQRWNVGVLLAAAALLAIALLPQLFVARAPEFEVALAPGYALAEDWASAQPELSGASAPGIAVLRGAPASQRSAAEFLRASELAEAAVASHSLSAGRRELAAGWFVVPLDLEEAANVVVVALPESGPGLRLFPEAAELPRASAEASLSAGKHLLPSPRAVAGNQPHTLDYRPGFLVPMGVRRLSVLVGARAQALDQAALDGLDRGLASGETPAALAARMERLGFRVQQLTVREP